MSSLPVNQTTVSLYEAKTHLSKLGKHARGGEKIVVTIHGKPEFMLVPVPPRKQRPLPGSVDLGDKADQWPALAEIDWFERDEERDRLRGTRELD